MARIVSLSPRPGFRWQQVAWGAPDQTRTKVCSYCGDKLPRGDDDFIPLILSTSAGWVAEFCDHCQATWFQVEKFDEPGEPVHEPEVKRKQR